MTNPFDSSAPKGSITTSSRLRAWFLKTFRGYRVLSNHRLPKQNSFGEIYYTNSWILVKRSDDDVDESDTG